MAAARRRRTTDAMTTISAENPIPERTARPTRRTVTGFLAGVVLTAAVAVGVNAAAGEPSSTRSSIHAAHAAAQPPEPGCFVVGGAC